MKSLGFISHSLTPWGKAWITGWKAGKRDIYEKTIQMLGRFI